MYPFTDGSFAPRNAWYVAAHPAEVTRTPLARDILNEPVVLYRRQDGRAVAVGGRCPHRHYPLGCGSVEGDAIVCGYHGIAFGDDGRCLSIPSQAVVPGVVRIPSYPLVEHGLWLFIWMGEREADPAMLPPLAEIGFEEPGMVRRAFFADEVKARAQILNDNLLDLSHVGFLHSANIGTDADATAEERIEKRDRFVGIRRYTYSAPSPPVAAASGLYAGLIDRVVGGDFHAPGLHATISETLYPADHPEHGGESIARGWFYHAITPVTATTCRYFFSCSLRGVEADLDGMERITRGINDEDIAAAERIETMLGKLSDPPQDLLIRTDRAAVEGRRLLQEMMDRERPSPPRPAARAA